MSRVKWLIVGFKLTIFTSKFTKKSASKLDRYFLHGEIGTDVMLNLSVVSFFLYIDCESSESKKHKQSFKSKEVEINKTVEGWILALIKWMNIIILV